MNNESTNWPKWATEQVHIEPYNPEWPVKYERLVTELTGLYSFDPDHLIHVGSTAVPGLAAKPIIDLAYPVPDFSETENILLVLGKKDWHLIPLELDAERYHRRTFVKVVDDRRFAHLHLILSGSGKYELIKRFRNILLAHPALVEEYADLKAQLAERYQNDRELYTAAKSNFITSVLDSYFPGHQNTF
ncbi:GrpB family protein [Mucilaginibacter sp. 21P]|uniref:GrpB family protein n=1 Tax=Mucilaginibacter sp. 21P TaxID=2778902 RepID=UPI001C5A1321|nr:GrpB family protein [Mucilaginibacter sp. 21P]QXV66784.1 GrpB family protein [Mucilaginibacter sp. 21P]